MMEFDVANDRMTLRLGCETFSFVESRLGFYVILEASAGTIALDVPPGCHGLSVAQKSEGRREHRTSLLQQGGYEEGYRRRS